MWSQKGIFLLHNKEMILSVVSKRTPVYLINQHENSKNTGKNQLDKRSAMLFMSAL